MYKVAHMTRPEVEQRVREYPVAILPIGSCEQHGPHLPLGTDIYLVGADAIPEATDTIKAGDMTGTVLNDHIGQSHTAIDVAIRLMNGEPVDKYMWINYIKITN